MERREGDGEEAHQHVADRQVHDEDVGRTLKVVTKHRGQWMKNIRWRGGTFRVSISPNLLLAMIFHNVLIAIVGACL